jgi:arginine decarboxylase-like protein
MSCLRTTDSGRAILGNESVLKIPTLEVNELAPPDSDPEKNENKKTPITRKGTNLSGRKSPKINPKTKPYISP